MLTSLFGDLGAANLRKPATDDPEDAGFAATAIMESVATEVNARGQIIDRHSHDLVVTGSPAQAIRGHFADTRSNLDTASSLITLLDPAGVWASAVIKALSDAGGRPVERLHLRERNTLRTLATIERTTLVRRHEDTLRIYHADVRATGSENAEIPVALMERSQMTTVIIGPLQPHAIDALLLALQTAAMLPTWRCPNLLFMLPPNAIWIANKVSAMAWPGRLHVHVLSESMTSASAVWNALLGVWNQVKTQTGWAPNDSVFAGVEGFPIRVAELTQRSMRAHQESPPEIVRVTRSLLEPARAQQALTGMLALDGLIGCAIVDVGTGLVLARQTRDATRDDSAAPVNMELAAAGCAQVLRAHRQAARNMGDRLDEVITSAGPRQQVMRMLPRHPELFLIVLLDQQRTNLALVRYRTMEVARSVG